MQLDLIADTPQNTINYKLYDRFIDSPVKADGIYRTIRGHHLKNTQNIIADGRGLKLAGICKDKPPV